MVSLVGTVDRVRIAKSDEMSWNTTSLYSGWISGFMMRVLSGLALKGGNFDLLVVKVQVFSGCHAAFLILT